jgi:hypothetical protein
LVELEGVANRRAASAAPLDWRNERRDTLMDQT